MIAKIKKYIVKAKRWILHRTYLYGDLMNAYYISIDCVTVLKSKSRAGIDIVRWQGFRQ